MRKYELLTIFKPNLDSDEIDKVLEKVDSDLAELGGKVESRDKMGRKKLAYDIQRALKLNDNVLRTLMLVVEEKASV